MRIHVQSVRDKLSFQSSHVLNSKAQLTYKLQLGINNKIFQLTTFKSKKYDKKRHYISFLSSDGNCQTARRLTMDCNTEQVFIHRKSFSA